MVLGRRVAVLALYTLLAAPGPGPQDRPLVLAPDDQHVVASRLEGEWILDAALTARLWPGRRAGRGERLGFAVDPAVFEAVPERVLSMLSGLTCTLAGTLTRQGEQHPFLLVTLRGNSQLIWFAERDGQAFGDLESFIVSLARAEQRTDDLLLVGGDFNNQPFVAFQRVERPGALDGLEPDPRERFSKHWETEDPGDPFSLQLLDDGTVLPYHDGREAARQDAGRWSLVDATTVSLDLAGATSRAVLDDRGRLVWTPPPALGQDGPLVLVPRHDH